MKLKKAGKIAILLAASTALVASLLKDNKDKYKLEEESNQESN